MAWEIRMVSVGGERWIWKEGNPVVMDWTGGTVTTPWFKKEIVPLH